MANINSQKKRNRQNVVRAERNKAVSSEMKTLVKKAVATASSGDATATEADRRAAQRAIDDALNQGIIKKNTAARRKSRLDRDIKAAQSA